MVKVDVDTSSARSSRKARRSFALPKRAKDRVLRQGGQTLAEAGMGGGSTQPERYHLGLGLEVHAIREVLGERHTLRLRQRHATKANTDASA